MMTLDPVHAFDIEEFLLTRMAFSPDGRELAVGHKQFRAYGAEDGLMRREFAFSGFIAQLAYSPDGRFIAAANVADNHPRTPGSLAVFDAASGRVAFEARADAPVETFALDGETIYWNAGEHARGVELGSWSGRPDAPFAGLHLKSLARGPAGLVAFGREAAGATQTVDNANLVFRKFRLRGLDPDGRPRQDFDLGIGAGVHALSSDGRLLAVEMVDFKNNERHVSLIDVETGVEANLLPLEANTLPVLAFGLGSEYLLCMKEDAAGSFNRLRLWRTSDLKLVGEAEVALHFHSLACCLEHSLIAFLGGGRLEIFALA